MVNRLRHIAGTRWGQRVYLDMEWLREAKQTAKEVAIAQTRDMFFPSSGAHGRRKSTRKAPVPGSTQSQLSATP
jgi:hypothetical protein